MTRTARISAPPQRVFEGRRIWRLSPDLLNVATRLIAAAEQPFRPELIIGIQRGGGPLAAALAELLDLPHALVSARHNPDDSIAVQGTGNVILDLNELPDDADGRRILLVDDICGSGATITAVGTALERLLEPAAVRAAVLCRNSGSPIFPDTWVWDVSDWTVFPWEPIPATPTELLPAPTEARHP